MSIKSYLVKFIPSILLTPLLIFTPTFAIDKNKLDFFAQNNILFYDPDGYSQSCTKLEDIDPASILWNILLEEGFSDAQASGILGNAYIESGFNPVRESNTGEYWGLFQWDENGRWPKIKYALESEGFDFYLANEYTGANGLSKIPLEDLKKMLYLEIQSALEETRSNWVSEIKKTDSPEAASDVFLVLFEGAVGTNPDGDGIIEYYDIHNGEEYQAASARRNAARSYFDNYSSGSYCATNPYDPLTYIQRFIIDTNNKYGFNYIVPTSYTINTLIPSPLDDSPTGQDEGCWGGTYCGQCTALSGWFVTRLTGYIYGGGDGGAVVSNLKDKNPGIEISYFPTPFSVFSDPTTSEYGHTGIVLDILDNNEYITIENNMGSDGPNKHSLKVRQRTFSSRVTFVDLSGDLKLENLKDE